VTTGGPAARTARAAAAPGGAAPARHIPHVPVLDGVRALSIVLVILTHTAPLGPKALQLNAMAGPMGMSLFFCLSGYLIVSMIHLNPDPVAFLIRRGLRIVPSVALYMALMAVFFGISWRAVAANLLFVTNYLPVGLGVGEPPAPLSHLWSLSVEMQFYVLIAALTWAVGRRSVWVVPVLAVVITGLRIRAGATVDIATHLRADEIMTGGTLALATLLWGDRLRAVFAVRGRAVLALVPVTALWVGSSHGWGGALMYARPYLAATLVGILMHSRLGVLTAALESRPAAYVARISYALYIYHPLMIFGWMNAGSSWTRYLLKRPLSYALTWAAAHASTYVWERHWQRLARRLTDGRAPA